jgi:hypothetical protein
LAKDVGHVSLDCGEGEQMSEPGLQRIAYLLLLALTLYVAVTGAN